MVKVAPAEKASLGLSDEETYIPNYYATKLEVWLFGVAIVLGGDYYGWTVAFTTSHFGTYAIAQVLVGIAYTILVFCIAEINSAIPGSAFNLTRVCIGFHTAFIVGALECLEYILYTTSAYSFVASAISPYFGPDPTLQLVVLLLLYAFSTIVVLEGGNIMWKFTSALGIYAMAVVVLYCIAALPSVNFSENAIYIPYDDVIAIGNTTNMTISMATNGTASIDTSTTLRIFHEIDRNSLDPWFANGFVGFLMALPYSTFSFGGIECISLVYGLMKNPRHDLPYAIIYSVLTLFAAIILLMFVFASSPPGIAVTASANLPMNTALNRMFQLSDDMISTGIANPSQFAMGFCFMLPSCRLFHTMGQANLMPKWMNLHQHQNTNRSLIICNLIGFLVGICSFYEPLLLLNLNNIAILAGFLTYLCLIIGYIMLQGRYSNIDRTFRSPFGLCGAAIALFIFFLGSIASFGYQGLIPPITLLGLVFTLSIYYYVGPKTTQTLTKEEMGVMFRMSMINLTMRKRRAMTGKSKLAYAYDYIMKSWRYAQSEVRFGQFETSSQSDASDERSFGTIGSLGTRKSLSLSGFIDNMALKNGFLWRKVPLGTPSEIEAIGERPQTASASPSPASPSGSLQKIGHENV